MKFLRNFLSAITRIQYALCRRNTINQGITINSERKGSPRARERGKRVRVRSHKEVVLQAWDGLGIGGAYIRDCASCIYIYISLSIYIYSWVKDNIFILVPTTISRTRSAVARVHAALFIFPLRTRDKRQSTFPVANSNTLFEKIMWRKYCCSLFDARKSVNIFAYYFANCKLAFAMYIYDDWADYKKTSSYRMFSHGVSCSDLCISVFLEIKRIASHLWISYLMLLTALYNFLSLLQITMHYATDKLDQRELHINWWLGSMLSDSFWFYLVIVTVLIVRSNLFRAISILHEWHDIRYL